MPLTSGAASHLMLAPLPLPHPLPFDHERLGVYQLALEFFDLADEIIENLPRGRGQLAAQLTRASIRAWASA